MKKIYFSVIIALLFSCFNSQTSYAQACSANYTYTNVGSAYTFTDASTPGLGSIISRLWNFGDLSTPSTSTNPTHTYSVCGVYTVSLTIITTAFCTNTYTSAITVNSGMTGAFTSTVDTTTGIAVFQGSPLGLNVNYSWDFGDGGTGTNAIATHTYPSSGTYYVCLTVSDTGGICTNTVCDSVVVNRVTPSCSSTFTYTDNGTGNLTFQVAPFSLTHTYAWDYGDGTTGTGPFALHTYATFGTYYVCLTTTDSATMCTSTFCDSVTAAGGGSCAVSFTNTGTNGVYIFNATPLSLTNTYAWDFGDGSGGANAVANHTYTASGTYYACVTMTDAFDACSNMYCDSITVTISGSTAGITENNDPDLHLTAYPNPINDQVTIQYQLNQKSMVTISIHDLLGNKIETVDQSQHAGKQQLVINTANYSKGAYLIKLSTNNGNTSKLIIKN